MNCCMHVCVCRRPWQWIHGKDLTIQNIAGVAAGQAVAFLSTSDRSVCYHCDLDGFQDTLNADKNLQFYHSCNISGTVDFVFGYAKAVFQECNLIVRRPRCQAATA